MPFWNRDLATMRASHRLRGAGEGEPMRAWCDGCFPVYQPASAERFGPFGIGTTNEEFAAHVFGGGVLGSLAAGVEHMIELALTSSFYADAIERYMTDETRWPPRGYAWANWLMGVPCEACGAQI